MRCGGEVTFARTRERVESADALVIPGVANVGHIIRSMDRLNLRMPTLDAIAKGKPVLAVCAGYQLLFDGSEEAPQQRGLGVFAGTVQRLAGPRTLHMGWNRVEASAGSIDSGWAYFAHRFAAPSDGVEVCATSQFGVSFASASRRENVLGVQFHPERSGEYGAGILQRFVSSIGSVYAR